MSNMIHSAFAPAFFRSLRNVCLAFGLVLLQLPASADNNVGIGTFSPDTSAVLDIHSTNRGVLLPRMTTAQRDSIVLPATSLMIFNTTTNRHEFNSGTRTNPVWTSIVSNNQWNLTGNTGILPGEMFLGTTDAKDLIIKTDGKERMRVSTNGNVAIGSTFAGSRLTVAGDLALDTTSNGVAGRLRFYNPARTFYSSLGAGNQDKNINYTLPAIAPTQGQFLSTDSLGNLGWSTVNQLPNGGTNINSTLIWNGINWVPTQNITLNNNTINVGGPTIGGSIRFYDNSNHYVEVKSDMLTQNNLYFLPNVGDSAYFVMTKGNQIIGGNKSFTNNVSILGGSDLRWYEPTIGGNNYISFKAPLLASDLNYTLPNSYGAAGQVLSTDGTGSLNWITPPQAITGSGSAGTLAIWNGTTSLTNTSALSFNTINNYLGIGTSNPGARVDVSNGNIFITNTNNTAGEIRWYEPSNSGNNFTSFRAQAQSNNITYTWPAIGGTPGQILTSGSGDTLSWMGLNSLAWTLNGNSGTNANSPNFNFIGTTDNQSFAIRSNNIERMRFRNDGGIILGNNTTLQNSYGKIQINDNSTNNNYGALGVLSTGVVTGANSITFALQASKQSTSTTNVAGYFIAASGTNNYGVVVGNGGNVFLGQVDSLTPDELRFSILPNGNPNRTYAHHLNLSGTLVASQQSGGFGPGTAGDLLVSQGPSSAPQWSDPKQALASLVWKQGGNSISSEQTLGTSTAASLPIVTNNVERMRITGDGRVGIGTNAPAASAAVDIYSTSKGMLIPRMTGTQRDAIATPTQGLMVYVTNANEEGFWYFNGTKWAPIMSAMSGNSSVIIKRKSSDQSISLSSVLSDDADMGVSAGSNQVWEVEGLAEFSAATDDPDVMFGFNAPAGSTVNVSYHSNEGPSSTFASGVNTGGSSTLQVSAGVLSVVHFRGIVETGAGSGDIRLRWAQNSSNINATTLKRNSYLKFTRIQ